MHGRTDRRMKAHTALGRISLFLVDIDGVVVKGRTPIVGAPPAIEGLRGNGATLVFVTNNASRSRTSLARELGEMGIEVTPEQTLTTAYLAARHLLAIRARRAFMVGEAGLREELAKAGLILVRDDAEDCDAVVVGIDRAFTYGKMASANRFIRKGATFIATNTDATLPTERGEDPGAGAIVASIATCTGRRPTIMGKPSPNLVRMALDMTGKDLRQTAVVGDRPETDMAMARASGCLGILLLTGVSTRGRREDYALGQRPHLVFSSLQELSESYRASRQKAL
jgi:4-nitrophenyl phosphatase